MPEAFNHLCVLVPLLSHHCFDRVVLARVAHFKNCLETKYARILLFQFVFTKYVFSFRNYVGLIFVVFDVIFQNVIMSKYDKIRF